MTLSLAAGAPAGKGLAGQFITLGAAEMANRMTRIATALALAWALTPAAFGVAALALTTSEILRALTQTGIGARIVNASDEDLDAVCNAAYRLNWWAYGCVAALQCAIAYPVAQHFAEPQLGWLLCLLAIPYLLYPVVAVQVYRLQRRQETRAMAMMLLVLISGDNLLTALMAICGAGLWSLAVPKIICALAWVAGYRRLESWRPGQRPPGQLLMGTLRFGAAVLLSELLQALRQHADKLVIGHMLGVVLLGQYFFAFNAGLGITTALISAASVALLPYFSRTAGKSPMAAYVKGTAMLFAVVTPFVAVQVALAPWYVPLVFGSKWVPATDLLMLMGLLAMPFVLSRSTSLYLRARGWMALDVKASATQAIAGLAALLLAIHQPLETIVIWQAVSAAVVSVTFALITLNRIGAHP